MKTLSLSLALTGIGPLLIFAEPSLLDMPELKSLAAIESGNDNDKKGKKGERGIYQISSIVWKEHGKKACTSKQTQSELAFVHIRNCLVAPFMAATKRIPTNKDVYLMWNLGFEGYARCGFEFGVVNRVSRNAATRYDNLVKAYKNKN